MLKGQPWEGKKYLISIGFTTRIALISLFFVFFNSVELERNLYNKTFEDYYSLISKSFAHPTNITIQSNDINDFLNFFLGFINQSLFTSSHKKIDQVMRGQRLPSQPSALVNDNQILNLLRSPVSINTAWNLLKMLQQKISHLVVLS